jgi:zinc transporter ZupT
VAIAIHNIPEGLATFVGALSDAKVGGSIAAAIAIHNIPGASGLFHAAWLWACCTASSKCLLVRPGSIFTG